MRKFVASESNPSYHFGYGTEADTTLTVSKRGRRITPMSWAIPLPHIIMIFPSAAGAHAEARLTPH